MDNYEKTKLAACRQFAAMDLKRIAEENNLKEDEHKIYINYLCREYFADKKSGIVYREDNTPAGYTETLSIFDLLCHSGEKTVSGEFAGVNSLNDAPAAAGVPMDSTGDFADALDLNFNGFISACKDAGMLMLPIADEELCIFSFFLLPIVTIVTIPPARTAEHPVLFVRSYFKKP